MSVAENRVAQLLAAGSWHVDARRDEHLRFVGNNVELALDITAVRAE
jgi:hypothetical protein